MQLLQGGRQLQERNSLIDYGIGKGTSIFLVSSLNDGDKGWDTPSISKSKSFKYSLKPRPT